jgi:hypothetical protein
MEWEPITITRRKVRGRNASTRVCWTWTSSFHTDRRSLGAVLRESERDRHLAVDAPPTLSGSTVRITPPDDDVEKYAQHIEERVAHANQWFEETALP